MSHVVEIQTHVRDATAVATACGRLNLERPTIRTVTLFSSVETGLAVQLPQWRYPVVCDLAQGTLKFDNFGGVWGDQKQLDRFLQAYAVEKASLEARKNGHTVFERALPDGSIKLTVHVGD